MKLEELGRRAVACPRWRWMPGMRALVGPMNAPYRYLTPEYAPPEGDRVGFCDPMPDLSDPATLGCLLHLVRETWRAPHAAPQWDQRWQHWATLTPNYNEEYESWRNLGADNTEAEALVAALEAAP